MVLNCRALDYPPHWRDVNVARREGTDAAAVASDTLNIVIKGNFHQRASGFVNEDSFAVWSNEGGFRHGGSRLLVSDSSLWSCE